MPLSHEVPVAKPSAEYIEGRLRLWVQLELKVEGS